MLVPAMAAALIGAATMPGTALAVETLNGAGGTAIYPVLSKWAASYEGEKKVAVNYQAIGSGGGIAQIKAKTVDFANSDKPLKPEELKKLGLAQFPGVIIAIVPVVHLAGIHSGEIRLDGKTLADIYLGKIKKWNDPALQRLNKGVKFPDKLITVVHRSDGSGTTFNFANYLSKVSPTWKDKVGADTSVAWPAGVGGKGNAGVAAYVQRIDGAIGYVEYAYAMQNKLVWCKMVNHDGITVRPDMSTFQAAAKGADFGKVKDFYLILTDQPGKDSWPITAGTYMLMRKDYDKSRNQKVLHFVDWFLTSKVAANESKKLDYVPLPPKTVHQIEQYWKSDLGI
jgi:phosphate transport system substrate-binding protein